MAETSFTPQTARRLKFIRDAGFVGDGEQVFSIVAEIDDEAARATHTLWMCDSSGAARRRLGAQLGDIAMASPSPDGRLLAVLADRDGEPQIWLVPVEGQAQLLTGLPQGVSGRPVWSPDGRSIAFTAGPSARRDESLPYRIDRATYRFDGLGYLDDVVTDVYTVDVTNGHVRALTSDRAMNTDPRWSPDGQSLLYRVSFQPDRSWSFLPELHVVPATGGEPRVVVGSWGGVSSAEWCLDGNRIAFVGCPSPGSWDPAQKEDLWTVDVVGGEPECRTSDLDTGVGMRIFADQPLLGEPLVSPRICVRSDLAYVSGQLGGNVVIYRVRLSGSDRAERTIAGEACAYVVDVAPDGGTLYVNTSLLEPSNLMLGPTCLTALNDEATRNVLRPQVRRLRVTAPDGLQTEAWALTPPDETGPWPTVLCLHGGPYAAYGNAYMIDFHLLVSAGFAVVFGNFRGSYGYGAEFARKIVGAWGPAGALDHHATVDEAIRAGVADSARVGVYGFSHGGFAACWLTGTSDRFRAAVAENPVINWESTFGATDAESWMLPEFEGTPPHGAADAYRSQSALIHASQSMTPTLFIVGEDDMRCHPVESEQHFRILRRNGVPSEMLRLPNSAHAGSLNGPVPARIAQNEALVDWFTRYLT